MAHLAEHAREIEGDARVVQRGALDGGLDDVIAADVVAQHHVEGRRGAALLAVAFDRDAVEVLASEEQPFDLVRVAVVVDVDGTVRSEEAVELVVPEGVRVARLSFEDHEVRYVHDADAHRGAFASEDGSGDDHFEHEFGADPDKDDVGVEAVICAAEFPDACPGLTVLVGFFDGEENGLRLFGTDHQVHVVLGAEAVSYR